MGELFDRIRRAVAQERYVLSLHADDMLRERSIAAWQIVAGVAEARLLLERPADTPNPCIEAEQLLADGTPVKTVWAHIRVLDAAKLVTIHFFDGER